jgi:hypothetical protein
MFKLTHLKSDVAGIMQLRRKHDAVISFEFAAKPAQRKPPFSYEQMSNYTPRLYREIVRYFENKERPGKILCIAGCSVSSFVPITD